jgi:hypothetical protein
VVEALNRQDRDLLRFLMELILRDRVRETLPEGEQVGVHLRVRAQCLDNRGRIADIVVPFIFEADHGERTQVIEQVCPSVRRIRPWLAAR